MTRPYLSAIVVSWNSVDELPECLACLERAASRLGRQMQVILVDNASSDGSADVAESINPRVEIVRMPVNVGFPRACNAGLESARGEHVLFLNPDVRVGLDSLSKCANVLDSEPSVGLIGIRLVDATGRVNPETARRFPSMWWLLCETFFLHRLFPRTRMFGGLNYGEWDHASSRDVPCIMGAFMFFRGDVLRAIGGLDDSVFMYFEDVDACRAVWNRGYAVRYLWDASAEHTGGASRSKSNLNLDGLKGEVAWRFAAKWESRAHARAVTGLMVAYAIVRLVGAPIIVIGRRIGGRPTRAQDLLLGSVGVLRWAVSPKRWPNQAS